MGKCKTPAQADAKPIEDMVPVVLWAQNGAHARAHSPSLTLSPPGHPGCFFMRGVAS